MIYLTYTEYKEIGGTLEEAAFTRQVDRVCGIMDSYTHKRLSEMRTIPNRVKACVRDLVEYYSSNSNQSAVTSRSQSAGGVSESESYKSDEEIQLEVEQIVFDYLNGLTDDYFTPLLYRGAMR